MARRAEAWRSYAAGSEVCAECGKPLEGDWRSYRRGVRRFCSPKCRYRFRDRERYADPTYRAAKLAKLKAARDQHRKPRKCRTCDQPATSQRHHYCAACRRKAEERRAESRKYRSRRTPELLARERERYHRRRAAEKAAGE